MKPDTRMPRDALPERRVADMRALVVVLATGEGRHLERCVASLRRQTHEAITVACVGTRDVLALPAARAFGEAHVVADDVADICPAANGLGSRWGAFDVVVFIRDDVELAPDAVAQACEGLEASAAGAVGGKVYSADNRELLAEVGMSADRFGTPFSRLEGFELDQAQHDLRRQTLYVSFAFLAIRGPLLEAIGGFDPCMRGRGSDLDLCWRLRLTGEDVVFIPGVRSYMLCEAESDGDGKRRAQRNQLWMVAKNYGPLRAIRFSAEAVLLGLVAALAALAAGRPADARANLAGPGWVFVHLGALWRQRRATQRIRHVRDRSIVRYMLGATARLRLRADIREAQGAGGVAQAAENIAGALGGRWLFVALFMVVFVLLAGRSLLSGPLPAFGRLGPPDMGAAGYLGSVFTPWRDVALGSGAPQPPALFLSGLAGFVALGSVVLAQRILLLFGLCAAAFTCARSLRPMLTFTASRVVAAVVYAFGPLWWNALAHGDLGAVFLAILLPSIAVRFAFLARLAGYGDRKAPMARKCELVLLIAIATASEPAALWPISVMLVGWCVGSILVGGAHRCALVLWDAMQILAGVFVLLLPWSFSLLFGDAALRAFAATPQEIPFFDVIRFNTGRFGAGVLPYGLLILGLLPLVLARGERFAWAARWWAVAILSFFCTWLVGLGFLPSIGRPEVLLASAGLAIAALAGIGVEAIHRDLPELSAGTRQPLSVVLLVVGVVGLLAPLAALPEGRFGQPNVDWRSSLSWQGDAAADDGPFLTVFVGRDVPGDPSRVAGDLDMSIAWPGGPALEDLWMPATTEGARGLEDAVKLVVQGRVPNAGRLLAAYAVRYIAVPHSDVSVSDTLSDALDLRVLQDDAQGIVFENQAWQPMVAGTSAKLPGGTQTPEQLVVSRPPAVEAAWKQAGADSWKGKTAEWLRAQVTFDERFRLQTGAGGETRSAKPERSVGWAMQFESAADQSAKLSLDAGPWRAIVVILAMFAWLAVFVVMIRSRGRRSIA